MFLGEDLPSWLVLAFGAALAIGNLAALIAPRPVEGAASTPDSGNGQAADPDGDGSESSESTASDGTGAPDSAALERPPLARSLVMIAIGTAASIWAIASLMS